MDFQQTYLQLPNEIRQAFSPGFVFMKNADLFQHFPARQWTDEQIKNYFQEKFDSDSRLIDYPKLQLKQVQVKNLPELFAAVPY